MSAEATFQGLPKWAQGVLAVGGLAIVGIIGYKIYSSVQHKIEQKDSKNVANEADDEYKKQQNKGQVLSSPDTSYASAINTIIKLLNGAETFGSELQVINEIAKVVKQPIDWYYLIKKFGVKDIEDIGWGKTSYDLTSLLKDQLDTAGAYSINVNGYKKTGIAANSIDILEGYLNSKGIQL